MCCFVVFSRFPKSHGSRCCCPRFASDSVTVHSCKSVAQQRCFMIQSVSTVTPSSVLFNVTFPLIDDETLMILTDSTLLCSVNQSWTSRVQFSQTRVSEVVPSGLASTTFSLPTSQSWRSHNENENDGKKRNEFSEVGRFFVLSGRRFGELRPAVEGAVEQTKCRFFKKASVLQSFENF